MASPPALRNRRYTPLAADGPLPWDMIRAVPAIRRSPLDYLAATVRRYGDVVAFPVPRGAALLMNDPDGARRVLQDNHRAYSKDTAQYRALSTVTGNGLLTADGERWRRGRAVVRPAFQRHRLEAAVRVAGAAGTRLQQLWSQAPGQTLDADEAVLQVMIGVVGRTLLHDDLAADGDRLVAAVDAALRVVVAGAASPVPASWPTPARHRLRGAVATIDEICADVVRRRRLGGVQDTDLDLPALLIRDADADPAAADPNAADPDAADPNAADPGRRIRDELVTMLIAGHETVAAALTWTLYLLAVHPSAAERLHAELDSVPADREPTPDDLARLPWTTAVVEESLRLYPPAWLISRRARVDDVVAGIRVPAGTLMIISPWLLHRRAVTWPEPEAFQPERFLPGGVVGRRPGGDYVPFGAGPRLCIGRDVALAEAVALLATLLRGRRVTRAANGAAVGVDALVTLRPAGGMPLTMLES